MLFGLIPMWSGSLNIIWNFVPSFANLVSVKSKLTGREVRGISRFFVDTWQLQGLEPVAYCLRLNRACQATCILSLILRYFRQEIRAWERLENEMSWRRLTKTILFYKNINLWKSIKNSLIKNLKICFLTYIFSLSQYSHPNKGGIRHAKEVRIASHRDTFGDRWLPADTV